MTTRNEYIAGLRQLADWLEEHPDVDVPYSKYIALPLSTNARVADFAAAAGVGVATDEEGNTQATLHFGPIEYYAYGYVDFAATVAKSTEETARTWADEHGLTLQPREGGEPEASEIEFGVAAVQPGEDFETFFVCDSRAAAEQQIVDYGHVYRSSRLVQRAGRYGAWAEVTS